MSEKLKDGLQINRRDALVGIAALVATFGGGALANPSEAMAGTGTMQYGVIQDAGPSETTLSSTSSQDTLRVISAGGTGDAVDAVVGGSTATGAAVRARNVGLGPGVSGLVDNFSSPATAVVGETTGTGVGVEGIASNASAIAVHAAHSASGGVALSAEAVESGVGVRARAGTGGSAIDVLAPSNGLGIVAVGASGARAIYAQSGGDQPAIHAQGAGTGAGLKVRADAGATAIDVVAPTHGTGISATAPIGGTALSVAGVARFSRAGRGSVGKGKSSATVAVPSGLAASSLILVTLQNAPGGAVLAYAARTDATHFKVVLTKKTTATAYFSWFVVG